MFEGGSLMFKWRRLPVSLFAAAFLVVVEVPACLALDEIEVRKLFIHEQLLKCYLGKRMLPEALKEYQTVLHSKPNDARMHFDYGNALLTMGNKKSALTEFKACARIQPGVPEYQAAVGAVSMMLKIYDQAVISYTRAVSLGGSYQQQLQAAQMYQAQQKELAEYNKQMKLQQDKEKNAKDDDD
jgi:tetratricopeptide (TPR) repeat protein